MANVETPAHALTGQVALVTGGGRGIGRAIALGLAGAGAAVAVVARSRNEIAEVVDKVGAEGGRAIAVEADVSVPEYVERMVHEVERALGPVDFLVNNAGLKGPIGPAWEVEAEEWWRCLEVNLRGPLLCSRAVLPGMVSRRKGRIVHVASGAGTMPIPYFSAYVTSKAALIRLTEIMAAEVAEHGVRVFAIEPGTVRTAMTQSALDSEEGRRWMPWFGQIFEQGRDVPPDEAAALVTLLATGRADALSGRFFTIRDDLDDLLDRISRGASDLQTLRLIR